MTAINLILVRQGGETLPPVGTDLRLQSPFSLASALKFGLVFLVLQVAGNLAQRWLGQFGFYAVSLVSGLISSASAVASAGVLAGSGHLSPPVAGVGAVVASLASALVNLPLVAQVAREWPLTRRIALALGLIVAVGAVGAVVGAILMTSSRSGADSSIFHLVVFCQVYR